MMILVFLIVGFGVLAAIVAGWRRWGEDENLTFGRDTPEKQAQREQRREKRRISDRSWPT